MKGYIAVLNAGSSSIKFALFTSGADAPALFHGQIERIGIAPTLKIANTGGESIASQTWAAEGFDHGRATKELLRVGAELAKGTPVLAVGHRVVHGGTAYATPIRIDNAVLESLTRLIPLAPLHQPHNLAPIRTIAEAAPNLPQVACFDTAFHRSQSRLAQSFAIPRKFTDAGIRRYGFHGLSYEYICFRLREVAPDLADGRLVIAHLGNGASLCAVHRGRSVAGTMGFTAVDGLMMGTRCGAIDPGVLLYLADEYRMDTRAIEDVIYRQSGLLGVSGISSDMRALRTSSEPTAAEAIGLFVYRIVRETGSLAAALGGLDGFVFTAGIGENDPATRAEVAEGCSWLGIKLEDALNAKGAGQISVEGSSVPTWVIPTDEERMIARHTAAVMNLRSP